jgi:hypothetical protein
MKLAYLFPDLLDISGVFTAEADGYGAPGYSGYWESSVDTTNGLDGVWIAFGSGITNLRSTVPEYRTAIEAVTLTAVKSIRWTISAWVWSDNWISTVHIYGVPSSASTQDHLNLWDETADVRIAGDFLDWGDIIRNTDATKSFRVRNSSTLHTALSPTVSMEVLSDSTPSYKDMHTFSADGGVTWYPAVLLPNIGPGGTSDIVQVRLFVPSTAQVGPWAARIKAAALAFV